MARIPAIFLLASLLAACTGNGGVNGTSSLPAAPVAIQPAGMQKLGDINPAAIPVVGGCQVFPAPGNPPQGESWFNVDISNYPLDPKSKDYIAHLPGNLHPDFGHEAYYGIPFNIVPAGQKKVPIKFVNYPSESDPGPYPFPPNAQIEGQPLYHTGDRHVLVLQQGTCLDYEVWQGVVHNGGANWTAANGAVWNLNTGALRPLGWTSADAAGLPIMPALIKCDEVAAGSINHVMRVTFNNTFAGYVLPAEHTAGNSDTNLPPMGERFRLKASYDISKFNRVSQIILTAMKKYGLIVADNGSNWYFQGQGGKEAKCWNDNQLNQLKSVPGSAFEAVETGKIKQLDL